MSSSGKTCELRMISIYSNGTVIEIIGVLLDIEAHLILYLAIEGGAVV